MVAYVAAAFWLAFVYAALKILAVPDTGRHSHLLGWAILFVAVVLVIATMDHWVRYLQMVLGGGILGGLLAAGTGHLLNGAPFPRAIAATVTALFVGCSLISRTLAKRRLEMFDRVALIGFLVSVVGGIYEETPIAGLIGFSAGLACLLAAWVQNRFLSSKDKSSELPNCASHS